MLIFEAAIFDASSNEFLKFAGCEVSHLSRLQRALRLGKLIVNSVAAAAMSSSWWYSVRSIFSGNAVESASTVDSQLGLISASV